MKKRNGKSAKKRNKNLGLAYTLLAFVFLMIGLAFASVPFYRAFCAYTGLGGTPHRVSAASVKASKRYVTVSFDSNVDSALPWDFEPEVKSVRMKLGEIKSIKYRAHNNSDKTLVGTATFNVQPSKAGAYFDKIQCFCFTKQVLKAGETRELPVQFYVDPSLADNKNNNDVKDITLSYTFFLDKDQSQASAINRVRTPPRARAKNALDLQGEGANEF